MVVSKLGKIFSRSLRKTFVLGGLALGVSLPLSSLWAAPMVEFSEATYITKPTRLWTEPSKFGEALANLDVGLEVKILSYNSSASWLRIITPGGREGWIPLRYTALTGRNEKPLANSAGDLMMEGPDGGRSPSSLPTETSRSKAVIGRQFTPWAMAFDLGYLNQLSRSAASGLLLGFTVDKNLKPTFALGLGLDFNYFGDKAVDAAAFAETTRSTIRLSPNIKAKAFWPFMQLSAGLGLTYDRTSFETRNTTNNEIITDSPAGLVTGSENNYAISLSLSPAYILQVSPRAQLFFRLHYGLDIDLSSGAGAFAGATISRFQHVLGAGLSFSQSL